MTTNVSQIKLAPDPGRARLLEEVQGLRERLDVIEGLIAGGALEPNPKDVLGRRTLSIKEAAEILEVHPNSLHRVAQAGLIRHDRSKGWGGGRGGQYLFSASELAEVKPHIRELVSKARKLLSVSEDKYVTLQEAVSNTGLTVRVLSNMLSEGKIGVKEAGDVEKLSLKDLYDAIIEANLAENQGRPGE